MVFLKNWMPPNFIIANFEHPVSTSCLKPWIRTLSLNLFQIFCEPMLLNMWNTNSLSLYTKASMSSETPFIYRNKFFSYTQDNTAIPSYGTRNATSSLLALPKCYKSIGQKCNSFSGPKVWNSSPEAIICAPSLPSFKSRYLKAMYSTSL